MATPGRSPIPPAGAAISTTGTTLSSARSIPIKGWRRFIPFLGYHHLLMTLCTVTISLLSFVLAGCAATGSMQNVHLIAFSYESQPPADETGGFMLNTTLAQAVFAVSQQRKETARYVKAAQSLGNISDPLGIVQMAHGFRTKCVSPGIIILCIVLSVCVFVILYTLPSLVEEVGTSSSSQHVSYLPLPAVVLAAMVCGLFASVALYLATAWQHIAVAAAAASVESATYGSVGASAGTASVVLAWLSVFLLFICDLGIVIMMLSIDVLKQLAD